MKSKLRILSLNCWGIPGCIPTLSSPHRKQRFSAIGEFLRGAHYDLVFLQEVWTQSDYENLVDQVGDVLPFSFYYKTGVIGSGTCIFSQHRLENVASITFTLNGYPHQVWLGDGLAGSGLGVARLRLDGLDVVAAVSHFHAEYNRQNDAFLADRCCQALEVLNVLSLLVSCDLILFCGDLNTEPGDLPHRLLAQFFTDTWQGAHQITWGNKRNSYTPSEFAPGTRAASLDYILYHGGPGVDVGVQQIELATEDRIPGGQVSYSDHEAVQAVLLVEKGENKLKEEREYFEDDLKEELVDLLKGETVACSRWQWVYGCLAIAFILTGSWLGAAAGPLLGAAAGLWLGAAAGTWLGLMAGAAAAFCAWMSGLVLQRRKIALGNAQAQLELLKHS